jgi:hypothetical protein
MPKGFLFYYLGIKSKFLSHHLHTGSCIILAIIAHIKNDTHQSEGKNKAESIAKINCGTLASINTERILINLIRI